MAEHHRREAARLREHRAGFANETREEMKARLKREAEIAKEFPRPIKKELTTGYVPTRRSRYYRCLKFKEAPFICPLKKSACKTCPHYDADGAARGRGRPKGSGVWDWDDPEEVREYHRLRAYYRKAAMNDK